jgi:hypothetical protein
MEVAFERPSKKRGGIAAIKFCTLAGIVRMPFSWAALVDHIEQGGALLVSRHAT